MPKFKRYTAEMVERQIRAIIKRNPDNINPQDYGDCLYHKGRGRNIKRCLIGQWGFEQGFRTPAPVNGDAAEVIDEIWSKQASFDAESVSLLSTFQFKADGGYKDDPIAWKKLLF